VANFGGDIQITRPRKNNQAWFVGIENPFTGFPIVNLLCSVTVAAEQCTQAGLLATLALLQGEIAETSVQ